LHREDEKPLNDDAFRVLAISFKLAEKREMTPEDLAVLRKKMGFRNSFYQLLIYLINYYFILAIKKLIKTSSLFNY